jgi:hypothetical protein
MKGVIIADEERKVQWTAIVRDVVGPDSFSSELPQHFDSEKAAIALLDRTPSFVLLPLTLPRFGSLRIAEWAHRRGSDTRLILVSGTDCETKTLRRLYDTVIRPGEFTVGQLQTAIGHPIHRLKDETKIDAAITAILEAASCFLVYARTHIFPHHPSIHDYRGNQEHIITVGNYFRIIDDIKQLRSALESVGGADAALIQALRAIENGSRSQMMTTDGPCVADEATPEKMRKVVRKALDIAEKLGLGVAGAALKTWLGL